MALSTLGSRDFGALLRDRVEEDQWEPRCGDSKIICNVLPTIMETEGDSGEGTSHGSGALSQPVVDSLLETSKVSILPLDTQMETHDILKLSHRKLHEMTFSVLPTIRETEVYSGEGGSRGSGASLQSVVDSQLEAFKVSTLPPEAKTETDESVELSHGKLHEIGHKQDFLQRHLGNILPQEFAVLQHELKVCQEQLFERDEEIEELQVQQRNTRLLLELLERMVSRHERSLRLTVSKRHAPLPAGVSCEVEVMKALKALFSQQKFLDEKLREKLQQTTAKCHLLEQEIEATQKEKSQLEEQLPTLSSWVNKLEDELFVAREDLLKGEEKNCQLQWDLNQTEDKNQRLRERLHPAEEKAEMLQDMEAQLAHTKAALSQAREREQQNADDNKRLSDSVDQLLLELKERTHLQLQERAAALEETNSLFRELGNVKKQLEETQHDKDQLELSCEALKTELDQMRVGGISLHHRPTGSQEEDVSQHCRSNASHNSLLKAHKKKGLKSTIRCLFAKKEKGGPEQPGNEFQGQGSGFQRDHSRVDGLQCQDLGGQLDDIHKPPEKSTGSREEDMSTPCTSSSIQDSLQKAPRKKGIKSSIRPFFGRKDKG